MTSCGEENIESVRCSGISGKTDLRDLSGYPSIGLRTEKQVQQLTELEYKPNSKVLNLEIGMKTHPACYIEEVPAMFLPPEK